MESGSAGLDKKGTERVAPSLGKNQAADQSICR
jgi:hypothetical protein